MTVIHLTRAIDSETLHVPELRALVGKTVDITIRESTAQPLPGDGWQALAELARDGLIDAGAVAEYREFDRNASSLKSS